MKSTLQIGSLRLENRLLLAPMAGITNLPFRLLVKPLGPALVFSEMISAAGLLRGQRRTLEYLSTDPGEGPLAVQLFGSDPEELAAAARMAVERGAAAVDINMGCPVRKVVKTGAGAALLRDPGRIEAVVGRVRQAVGVSLTVKMRAGWSPSRPTALEAAQIAEAQGADAVCVHGRFATQGFSGRADWGIIRQVKRRVRIPVIGNGDVFQPHMALRLREASGCDGVMIGRGAIGNPWIFRQIFDLEAGRPLQAPSLGERRRMILRHFELLSRHVGEGLAARQMRGLLMWYTRGLPGSSRFRGSIGSITGRETLWAALDRYFDSLEGCL